MCGTIPIAYLAIPKGSPSWVVPPEKEISPDLVIISLIGA